MGQYKRNMSELVTDQRADDPTTGFDKEESLCFIEVHHHDIEGMRNGQRRHQGSGRPM